MAGPGHAAVCRKIGHAIPSLISVIPGRANGSAQSAAR
jgi:hypothetical protein